MAFRMRWALYAALGVIPLIGALGGSIAANSKPPVYTAEARLTVGRANLVDAGAQQLAANYARFLTPELVLAKLPPGTVLEVTASPIPESNVIRVEARATDSPNAVEAARVGARMLQSKVTSLAGQAKAEQTLGQLQRISRQVATFQSRVNASGGSGSDYVDAATGLSSLQAQQSALNAQYQDEAKGAANSALALLSQAAATGDNIASRKQIYLLAGLGGGALLAYVLARLLGELPVFSRTGRGSSKTPRPQRSGSPAPSSSGRLEEPVGRPAQILLDNEVEPVRRQTERQVRPPAQRPAPARQQVPSRGERPIDRLSVFDAPEDDDDLEVLLPPDPVPVARPVRGHVPAQAEDPQAEDPQTRDPQTRDQPTINLRPHSQQAASGARRGLSGLRQGPPAPDRRNWP